MVRCIMFLSLISVCLFGCQASGNENQASEVVKEVGEDEVEKKELELLFDVTVANKQAVFVITLSNNSDEMKKLEFSSSQKYDIVVKDENEQEVYRYSTGKMFTQVIEYALIKQGESMQWEEVWDIGNVKPGKYTAEVSILSHDTDELVKKESFQIGN